MSFPCHICDYKDVCPDSFKKESKYCSEVQNSSYRDFDVDEDVEEYEDVSDVYY